MTERNDAGLGPERGASRGSGAGQDTGASRGSRAGDGSKGGAGPGSRAGQDTGAAEARAQGSGRRSGAGEANRAGPGPSKRASDPTASDPQATEGLDPGAFIGHEPEREAATIPGGVGPKDQRISAVATQPGPKSTDEPPAGHRDATGPGESSSDTLREAGQNR